jgi:hypothetical protein
MSKSWAEAKPTKRSNKKTTRRRRINLPIESKKTKILPKNKKKTGFQTTQSFQKQVKKHLSNIPFYIFCQTEGFRQSIQNFSIFLAFFKEKKDKF